MNNLTIGQKLTLSFLTSVILILVTGSAGYYGITQLNERLAYVTSPAWDTADGAMEGTIAVQQQMNAILEIVQGKEPERYEQQIEKALIFGQQAFDRVFESELLEADVITNLKKQVSGYQDLRDPILAKNEEFQEYDRQLRASFETFRSLMVQVEEFGDGAVEELENNRILQSPGILGWDYAGAQLMEVWKLVSFCWNTSVSTNSSLASQKI